MVKITINGKVYNANSNQTILEVCKKNNIYIPTLCYLKDINEIGACKICVVEIEGQNDLASACNTKVADGMIINTESEKVIQARITNLQLIMSEHNYDCDNCKRNNNCTLQSLVKKYDIDTTLYQNNIVTKFWNNNYSFIRDNTKCIKCMRCISICEKIQGLNVWDLINSGTRTNVGLRGNKDILNTRCVSCGQCVTHCPTGALTEKDETEQLLQAIKDPNKTVVVQVAPAIRSNDSLTITKIASALRKLGVDYVFDTNFAADVTILEEGNELVERLPKTTKLPMFTSCCPGWVSFIKKEYPELIKQLSTTKSPQQIEGALIKTYFAKQIGIKPKDIYSVSIMPCLAKKLEKDLPGMQTNKNLKDVDLVLTTREFIRLLNKENINISKLKDSELDSPLQEHTGGASLFGTTGGVMEAALRYLYFALTGKKANNNFYDNLKVYDVWKEAEITINKEVVRIAVVSGLANARKLIEAILNKEVHYNFVEVMACPHGCVGGGGQPIKDQEELAKKRSKVLYKLDNKADNKSSEDNKDVSNLYKDFLEKPLSHNSHKYLHVDHKKQ